MALRFVVASRCVVLRRGALRGVVLCCVVPCCVVFSWCACIYVQVYISVHVRAYRCYRMYFFNSELLVIAHISVLSFP